MLFRSYRQPWSMARGEPPTPEWPDRNVGSPGDFSSIAGASHPSDLCRPRNRAVLLPRSFWRPARPSAHIVAMPSRIADSHAASAAFCGNHRKSVLSHSLARSRNRRAGFNSFALCIRSVALQSSSFVRAATILLQARHLAAAWQITGATGVTK